MTQPTTDTPAPTPTLGLSQISNVPQPVPLRHPELFQPTSKQVLFWNACHHSDEIGYGGARGGAKTTALYWLAADMMSLSYPGNVGLVVRKDLVDLKATTMEEFRRFCGQYHQGLPIKWNMSSPIRCDLFTGRHDHRGDPIYSRIWWSDTKDPESWRSGNLGWCMIDEATEVSHDFVQMIRAALGRHTLPDGTRPPKRLVWASNPGPGWCKREYPVGTKSLRRMVDLELDDGSRGKIERVFIPATPRDNPHLPTDFEAQLRANYSEIWVKRWVEGDWSAFEGMVFPEFTVDRHVLPKKVDLSGYGHRHFLTMDWGYRNPAACMVVSKDGDDHWWVWKEYYAKERTPDQHSTFVRKRR